MTEARLTFMVGWLTRAWMSASMAEQLFSVRVSCRSRSSLSKVCCTLRSTWHTHINTHTSTHAHVCEGVSMFARVQLNRTSCMQSSDHVEEFACAPHQIYIITKGCAARCLSAKGKDHECARGAQHELPQLCERASHDRILIDFDNKIALLSNASDTCMQVNTPHQLLDSLSGLQSNAHFQGHSWHMMCCADIDSQATRERL